MENALQKVNYFVINNNDIIFNFNVNYLNLIVFNNKSYKYY